MGILVRLHSVPNAGKNRLWLSLALLGPQRGSHLEELNVRKGVGH